jgi:hypothetical protein
MWAEQALVLLAVAPLLSFAAVIVFEAFVASVAPLAAVALLVPAALAVVVLSMFWSAAIVAATDDVAEGRTATVAGAVCRAAAHLPAIAAWAFFSLTVGVAIRLVSSLFGRFGVLVAYAGGTAWSVATMLVLPAIVVDGLPAPAARARSTALARSSLDLRLTGQLGFDLVAAVLLLPAVALLVVAALIDNSALTSLALLGCFGAFIAAALVTSACLSVYRTMLYRQVHGRPLPELYGDATLRTTLVGGVH